MCYFTYFYQPRAEPSVCMSSVSVGGMLSPSTMSHCDIDTENIINTFLLFFLWISWASWIYVTWLLKLVTDSNHLLKLQWVYSYTFRAFGFLLLMYCLDFICKTYVRDLCRLLQRRCICIYLCFKWKREECTIALSYIVVQLKSSAKF